MASIACQLVCRETQCSRTKPSCRWCVYCLTAFRKERHRCSLVPWAAETWSKPRGCHLIRVLPPHGLWSPSLWVQSVLRGTRAPPSCFHREMIVLWFWEYSVAAVLTLKVNLANQRTAEESPRTEGPLWVSWWFFFFNLKNGVCFKRTSFRYHLSCVS